ncbi:MAG: double-strand break repair protein AddB [Hyphomicrobium sp.]
MTAMTGRIFTVPSGVPFLDALSRAVLTGAFSGAAKAAPLPHELTDITLLLPTRRATRALQDAMLAASGARALLMPQIKPISEGDEDASLLAGLSQPSAHSGSLDLPPAISALDRTLTLMQLVHHWRSALGAADPHGPGSSGNTPAQAANLAAELAKLMDMIETENVALDDIAALVPETYAEHWQKTVSFLSIVTTFWPAHLTERGLLSPADRRNKLIRAEAERLARTAPDKPVIIAGVTGSIPATVTLMKAVLALPNGAIVLPCLDTDLDDASWNQITPSHPEHPQFGLKKLLDALGVDRHDVALLPGAEPARSRAARTKLISEAMRPSATTGLWHDFTANADRAKLKAALAGVSLIEAPNAADEAEAVALILREVAETPGRTGALVSPDRLLARRVAIRLASWGIRVDDSAGRPFAKTVPGTFLNLVVDAVRKDFAPAELMALLKHPLCRLGFQAFDVRRYGRALEIMAFRAPYLGRGLAGVKAALDHAEREDAEGERRHPAFNRLWDEDRAGARLLVDRLDVAAAPLLKLYSGGKPAPLAHFARAHADAAEAIARTTDDATTANAEDDDASSPLWQDEAGAEASAFFVALLADDVPAIDIKSADYADLYRSLLARTNVRERTPVHPRLSIWGPFEARLQQPDVLVLGSLNDGTWPEAAEPGAWLNRPMRQTLGLPSPEDDIGRAAHDFMSLLGAENVYLTRAQKNKGVPTVPSRWLMRLKALLDGVGLTGELAPKSPWLGWARARDLIVADRRVRLTAPQPRPALELRPRKLSVSRIEDWIANPYSIFARRILAIQPLPALGEAPGQALRGALVHDVLSAFAKAHPDALPADIDARLNAIATAVLTDYTGHARVAAFWLPRLRRFLTWFANTEVQRRADVTRVMAETSGTMSIAAPNGPFVLTARADRIDETPGGLIITDYKTGQAPSVKNVQSARAPQLPLEAAIALSETGFPTLSGQSVTALRYIRASGGEPPGQEVTIGDDITDLAARALDGVSRLVAAFDDPDTPYRAIRRPGYRYDYDSYAGLARVAEWSAHVDEEA